MSFHPTVFCNFTNITMIAYTTMPKKLFLSYFDDLRSQKNTQLSIFLHATINWTTNLDDLFCHQKRA